MELYDVVRVLDGPRDGISGTVLEMNDRLCVIETADEDLYTVYKKDCAVLYKAASRQTEEG